MSDVAAPPGGEDPGGRKPRKKAPSPYENAPYEVGKGKAPKEHRFKKGGKPGPGRPKGTKNRSDFDKLLDQRIVVGEDRTGRPIRKTWRQVMNLQLMQQAAKGQLPAIKIAKEFELKMEMAKARQGEAPPTAEELMKQAKEDQERQELAAKLVASIIEHLEMMARLKQLRLLGADSKTWSTSADRVFGMIERGELEIDKASDEEG